MSLQHLLAMQRLLLKLSLRLRRRQGQRQTWVPIYPMACSNDFTSFQSAARNPSAQNSKSVHFKNAQKRILARHEKSPTSEKWNLRHSDFKPTKSLPDFPWSRGMAERSCSFIVPEGIANFENWIRQEALKLSRELHPNDISADTFFWKTETVGDSSRTSAGRYPLPGSSGESLDRAQSQNNVPDISKTTKGKVTRVVASIRQRGSRRYIVGQWCFFSPGG